MTGFCDTFQRPINYLRISVTDRCNLRCFYCMPDGGVQMLSHADVLTYEEIIAVINAATELGVNKVRLTGGEPLVRLGLAELVRQIAAIKAINDISLTTNGILLERYARELKEAGLHRVNVSLDSLKPERFRQITRCGDLDATLRGIEAAHAAGLHPVKINNVVMAGINDDELVDFARKTIEDGWNVRFIEYMPVATNPDANSQFVSVADMRKRIEALGELSPFRVDVGSGPAKYFKLPGANGSIGFITPVTEHFCYQCNRLRLTADGKLMPCLLRDTEIDIREPLRNGVSQSDLKETIRAAILAKPAGHQLVEGNGSQGRPFSQVGG